MKFLLSAILVLGVATAAAAQTNDCDVAAPTTFTTNAGTVTVTACWGKQDLSGANVVAKEWAVYIDGARSVVGNMTELPLVATPGGLYKFQGSFVLAKGSHTVEVEVVVDDGTGGTLSAQLAAPLAVKAKGAPPKAPVNGRVF